MEVYSVESVVGTDTQARTNRTYLPFYAYRHGTSRTNDQSFYIATRQSANAEDDRGTDVVLSLVDLGFDPYLPTESTLVVRTICTNRELPADLRRAGDRIAFELEAAAPLEAVRCLRTPTLPIRPPIRRGAVLATRLASEFELSFLD